MTIPFPARVLLIRFETAVALILGSMAGFISSGEAQPEEEGGGFVPASVAIVSIPETQIRPGDVFSVPVRLTANGGENALGFSLLFEPAKLSVLRVRKGPFSQEAILNVNTLGTANGRLGVGLALSAGASLTSGTWDVVLIDFHVAENAPAGPTSLIFGDNPVFREVVDVQARSVAANFLNGTLTIEPPLGSRPHLDIARAGSSVLLFWPVSATNYELEYATRLVFPTWDKVEVVPLEIGGQKVVSLGITNSLQYFRLRKP